MKSFFSNPTHRTALHAQRLESYKQSPVVFNEHDTAHTDLITQCTQDVKQKLLALQKIDRQALIGFSLGTAAFGLSFLLPFGLLATTAGFAYGTYQLGLRKQAYQDYVSALENLMDCCRWSLSGVGDQNSIKQNAPLQEMITTLAPITNESQLRECIDVQYESIFVKQAANTRSKTSVMGYQLDPQAATLYYTIYGYEQGGVLAILQGIGYAIVNALKALKRALTPSSKTPETVTGTILPAAELIQEGQTPIL